MLSEKGLPCVYALSAYCKMGYCNLPIRVRLFFFSLSFARLSHARRVASLLGEGKHVPECKFLATEAGPGSVYVSCRYIIGSTTGDVSSFTICFEQSLLPKP